MGAGMAAAQLRGDGALVTRVLEGEEQADGDRLGVELRQRGQIEGGDDPFGPDPLGDAVTALERDERLGLGVAEPVEMRARLPAQVEDMLEPGRADEGGARTLPLQQGVRRHRRPVGEPLDLVGSDRTRRGEHRLLLARRRRHLCRRQATVRDENGVGEGAADVDAEQPHRSSLGEPEARLRPAGSRPGAARALPARGWTVA